MIATLAPSRPAASRGQERRARGVFAAPPGASIATAVWRSYLYSAAAIFVVVSALGCTREPEAKPDAGGGGPRPLGGGALSVDASTGVPDAGAVALDKDKDKDADAPRPPANEPSEPSPETLEPFEGTAGITEKKQPNLRKAAVLQEVRTGGHDAFDRVVFVFRGGGVPGYHVEYLDKPPQKCGSGDAASIEGKRWLEIRMSPAQAHDEEGRATVKERELRPSLPVMKELEATCDFEAQLTWVIGVSSPNRYRILELSDPARLVVDVRR
jgi:hypothetical protein